MKIIKKIPIYILLLTIFSFNAYPSPEYRYITPPKLEKSNFEKKILCHRPLREGSPNISLLNLDNKIIANNYGHGGSGWTIGPGSAFYVNKLLIKEIEKNDNKDAKITIIGAGAIGFFSAYDLINKGYKNITIIAEEFDNLTSHRAGGLFAPVSISVGDDSEIASIITEMGVYSYKFYNSIAKGINQNFKTGSRIMPAYFSSREESGLEQFVGKVLQPANDVIIDFGNGTKRTMVAYDNSIYIDTLSMMKNLRTYLNNSGVKFIKAKITNFNDISDKYVINSTGLGAKELSNDNKLRPVQGHLIMLKDQDPKDLNYLLLTNLDSGKTKSGHSIKRSFYIMPKHDPNTPESSIGVIGGTFIEGADDNYPSEEEFDRIVQEARKFYGIK